ncbi:Uncharacterised protein [Vibrio cholerae]|uniref:Uncharacterized protein n=1 Tax=Vibrio cholerae TaxID=666 RepID=A0A655XU84_VIBCL|nr:Uncharacterised protein [Vibrio cholerae]
MPGFTRRVTMALTLMRPFSAPSTQTISPSIKPKSLASFGFTSTNISCCSSASQGLERVSSPPPSYSTKRPEVRMIGYSTDLSCA